MKTYFEPPLPEEIEEQIKTLYDLGLGDGQIARAIGVSKTAVWKWRQKLGLPPRPRPVSICWDCSNATAKRCFAYPFHERRWVKKYVPWGGGCVVLECEKFVPDPVKEEKGNHDEGRTGQVYRG